MENITLSNYGSIAPTLNWSKYPALQKEMYDQNKAGSLDFQYWSEFLEDDEIKNIVKKHIAVLNAGMKNSPAPKAASQPARKMSSSTASKPAQKAKVTAAEKRAENLMKEGKKRASAKNSVNSLSKERQKQNEKRILEIEVAKKYELVKQNARLKNNIGEELTKYLKENVVRLGLGGLPIDYEIEQLKAKNKFYSGILKNDNEDFKVIARRLGLSYRSGNLTATPKSFRKRDGDGKYAAAVVAKRKPETRTPKQRDSDGWKWVKGEG
jgi:hypothetical protein